VSVSLRRSCPACVEPPDDLLVVLDGPVVHDGDRAGAVDVRVGVAVGRRAVRGPAGVPDAERAGQRLVGDLLLEVGQLAGLALDLQRALVVEHGDARAVVAAVLEPAQAVEHHVEGGLLTDVPPRCRTW
jgi:hypothetical protein